MSCQYPGCDAPSQSEHYQYCYMHAKRLTRGADMSAPRRERLPPWERVVASALELADADSDDDLDFSRKAARLRYAARRWSRG